MGLPKIEKSDKDAAVDLLFSLAKEEITCATCGDVLYEENSKMAPTERRGWVLYIPHFCCCGRCSWQCDHNHPSLDIVCASTDINHSPALIRKES